MPRTIAIRIEAAGGRCFFGVMNFPSGPSECAALRAKLSTNWQALSIRTPRKRHLVASPGPPCAHCSVALASRLLGGQVDEDEEGRRVPEARADPAQAEVRRRRTR